MSIYPSPTKCFLFRREYDGLATRPKATRAPEKGSQPYQSQYHPEDLASGARVRPAFGLCAAYSRLNMGIKKIKLLLIIITG